MASTDSVKLLVVGDSGKCLIIFNTVYMNTHKLLSGIKHENKRKKYLLCVIYNININNFYNEKGNIFEIG